MDRRRFLLTSLAGALAAPLAADAQQAGKSYRLGLLDYSAGDSARRAWWGAFRHRLRDLGCAEGENIALEYRWADGHADRMPGLAAELVRLKVDVIVTAGTVAAVAARNATATTPIVMATGAGVVEIGLVTSLARPGGNVTGVTSVTHELSGKRLQLLRELLPRGSRFALLLDTGNPTSRLVAEQMLGAAKTLGVLLHINEVRSAGELENAFAAMARESVAGLIIVDSPPFFAERSRLTKLALKHRLPTLVGAKEYAAAGGLIGLGTDYPQLFRRAAEYVDKILKGANPADLPIEQPTKFELVINLKTAKALGLTIPPSLLARADQVIE
jgi:putative ABC transport system substrate-binding protein